MQEHFCRTRQDAVVTVGLLTQSGHVQRKDVTPPSRSPGTRFTTRPDILQ